ncbi:hypothetical protein KIN20_031543 [Parelaphostrongylus tenuis]|uniref:Neurotransmitter-gated ion-channel ligand-binding domain-containing protein n=1 Tax=Parelaphostrongylus tenuis TaxID=148309 RepID=A0AAD5R5F9_PARTN|nr:hypothetical protein KIN20_031543 [Parelaphostrongylus tenuis]
MNTHDRERLESCVFMFLTDTELQFSANPNSFHNDPPPEAKLVIQVDDVAIRHVQLSPGSTYQFQIYGDIFLNARLQWNATEWKVDSFYIHDTHKIWSPNLIDHSICTDVSVCSSELTDVEIVSEGRAYARLVFRYSAYCRVDYSRFPEDENHCCIFFTAFETDREVTFAIESDHSKKVNRPVSVQSFFDRTRGLSTLADEHSSWVVDEHTVEVAHLAGIHSLEVLKVCVHAEKKMSTIRMALKIPITIATLIMLVSPLFGDLRTQVYIKLFIFSIQTICFLYLCSISPPNGFAGTRPKIYTYYELILIVSSISLLMTLVCVALSRVKRTIAPTHRFYLAAKLVNRLLCCIEPDQATTYQRYIEDTSNQRTSSEPDATMEWRHVYLAINNVVSGMFFSLYLILVLIFIF